MAGLDIVPLPREEWKGTPIPMRYTTEEYYDLEITTSPDEFSVFPARTGHRTPQAKHYSPAQLASGILL